MRKRCSCVLLVAWLASSPMAPAGEKRSLDTLWEDLASADGSRAYAAIWAFTRTPAESIAFFETRLKPAAPPDRKHVESLIDDLSHERFAVRNQASVALEKLGDLPAAILREALDREKLPLEARQRVEKLLKNLRGPVTSPERLRIIRAVETIEYIGTPEARKLLERLARGAPGVRITVEAQDSLDRLRDAAR